MDAREVALLTLNACERQGGWSDGVLKKQLSQAGLDNRDAGLATQLCFGVLQNKLLLDFYLSQFSNIPLKSLNLCLQPKSRCKPRWRNGRRARFRCEC